MKLPTPFPRGIEEGMREFDRAAALGENREQTSSDRGSTPLASTKHLKTALNRRLFYFSPEKSPNNFNFCFLDYNLKIENIKNSDNEGIF